MSRGDARDGSVVWVRVRGKARAKSAVIRERVVRRREDLVKREVREWGWVPLVSIPLETLMGKGGKGGSLPRESVRAGCTRH